MKYVYTLAFGIIFIFNSCIEAPNQFSKLPPGVWRAVLKLDDKPVSFAKAPEEVEYKKEFDYNSELPFNFELIYDSKEEFHIVLINADERIKVKAENIRFGRDKQTAKDTIIFNFPVYDSYIKGIYEDGIIEGNWIVNYKDDYQIPFIAYHGKDERFFTFGKSASSDLTGTWGVKFEVDTKDEYPAVGEFLQEGNKITGTFLTETGDYRYLEGSVFENKAFLSCFDGSHAFLFEAKEIESDILTGVFRSGKHYTSSWSAKRVEKAELTSPFELTNVVGKDVLEFSFPNTDNQQVSLNDSKFDDKIKLVMIMGTWCPNCRDEMNFIKNYFDANPSSNVELIVVGFERYKDDEKSMAALKRYKDKMDLDFEVLYGGYASKKLASEKFPMLNKIISYPTLLFVDKQNKIRKIHTGFNGPATSKFEGFKQEFETTLNQLLNEG